MTRNRFILAKQTSSSKTNLSPSKAHQLFLEDNDNIGMKDTYKITNVQLPLMMKMLLIKSLVTITYYPLLKKFYFKYK